MARAHPFFAFLAALFLAASVFASTNSLASPASTNNDDSCDISVQPAATLLLPYFQVDFASPQKKAETTLFTITNVTRTPQIARVTIWTDYAFPVLDFNIFLTGYDVQAINLYDVFARGVIAPTSGTSSATMPGSRSRANDGNPGFLPSAAQSCSTLPGVIPASLLADVRATLTLGTSSSCPVSKVGMTHPPAIGYATIDVVATCSTTLPTDPTYFASELLFDNALIGDYEQINPNVTTGNYAGGNPLVHIRAVPEGGSAGQIVATNLPYTFYDRLTPRESARARDRRQPLPSTFATRYIQGGATGFSTNLEIWREGTTGSTAICGDYPVSGRTPVTDIVRFDEHENSSALARGIVDLLPNISPSLPASSSTPTSSSLFPPMLSAGGDVSGWIYLNLDNGGSLQYSVATNNGVARDFTSNSSTTLGPRQSQNWVITSMSAEGRYSVDFDASSLGNGCSPAPLLTLPFINRSIGPMPNANP